MRVSRAPTFAAATVGSRHTAALQSRGAAVLRAVGNGEGRRDGEGAGVSSLPTSSKRKRALEEGPQRQLVKSLGRGGHPTVESSPFVMWLEQRLALGGSI